MAGGLTLWYQQPAETAITEGLPIGNGTLGGLILGVPEQERVVLDEGSLWTGEENPAGNYETMDAVGGTAQVHYGNTVKQLQIKPGEAVSF